MYVVIQLLVFALAAILVTYLVRSYQNRLADLRRVSSDLAQRSVELEANKAELNRAQSVARVGSCIYDIGNECAWPALKRLHLAAEGKETTP